VEVEGGVFGGVQADGFVGVVFFGDEDGAEGFEVIPFFFLEVEEFLLLVFDLGFEDEFGSRFDCVVVPGLELLAGGVATVDDFVDAVADAFYSFEEGFVGVELVEFGSACFESFEIEGSGETDDVGSEGVDEVGSI
jgi:hypothetical protein